MRKFEKGQAYSDRLSQARRDAVEEALKGAHDFSAAAQKLEILARTPEFVAFNVDSPNNRKRLLQRFRETRANG